jgi:GxxExxY protein
MKKPSASNWKLARSRLRDSCRWRSHIAGEELASTAWISWFAERAVVELKAIQALENIHFAVTRSYMKALNTDCGLLLNFATMPLTVKRVGREYVSDS